MTARRTVLVVGATGNVGRHVVAGLRDAGAAVRAATREVGAARFPGGVDVVRADVREPDTVAAAAEGADAAFLVWPLVTTEAAPPAVEAIAHRVGRIVYLSSMGARDAAGGWTGAIRFHAEVERLVRASGAEWTFLRPSGFATNALMWAPEIRERGAVRWVFGGAARSLIHERDIAAVGVRALLGDGHAAAVHLLTAPATITQAEQVATIGRAIGRTVAWEESSPEEARERLLAAGADPAFVESALATWARFTTEPEPVTDTVARITGSPARSFAEWAGDHAADFR